MKVYVAGSNQDEAFEVAKGLKEHGHFITSTWIHNNLDQENRLDDQAKMSIANRCYLEILNADALVLLPSDYKVLGGKFVETGIAIGLKLNVYCLGRRENMLLYYPGVKLCSSFSDLVYELSVDSEY